MAWLKRGSSRYYYRSTRAGKRVFREYLGSGPEAELSAELDSHRREQRRENRESWTSFVSCLRKPIACSTISISEVGSWFQLFSYL